MQKKKKIGIIKQLLPLCESNMTICYALPRAILARESYLLDSHPRPPVLKTPLPEELYLKKKIKTSCMIETGRKYQKRSVRYQFLVNTIAVQIATSI